MNETASATARRVYAALDDVVVGNERATFGVIVALFAGGHVLLEGVPGTAKTLIVRALAIVLGMQFRRIQFTPDLMPADIVGTAVFDPRTASFAVRRGPLFTNVLLADEINRTPPKTQSALLEAMEERQATIDGETYALDAPFFVCATQNPIDFEGTYPLPEAQLDRFLIRARSAYPTPAQERVLLDRVGAGFDARELAGVAAVVGVDELLAAQADVRALHVDATIRDYVLAIALATRAASDVALGASPRATLGLLAAARAAAAVDGRPFVTPDDVKNVAPLVLAHRLLIAPEAELDGITPDAVVERVLRSVPVPA